MNIDATAPILTCMNGRMINQLIGVCSGLYGIADQRSQAYNASDEVLIMNARTTSAVIP